MEGAVGNVLLAYAIYVLGTASPGPAILAIASTSLAHGRSAGVSIALGVLGGSVLWGVVAAFWLTAATVRFPDLSDVLRGIGALYLAWLGARALRRAYESRQDALVPDKVSPAEPRKALRHNKHHFLVGVGIHLTNPKAVLVWSATILVGAPNGATTWLSALVVVGCALLGALVFVSYAVLFSSEPLVERYTASKVTIDLIVGSLFLLASLGVITGSF